MPMRSLLVLLVLVAVSGIIFKQEEVTLVAWVLGLALLFTWLWRWRVTRAIRVRRVLPAQAFLEDSIEVELQVGNRSRLPLTWLSLRENLPGELNVNPKPNWVLNLGGREQQRLHYRLECRTRGRYLIGPAEGQAGVVLEIGADPVGDRLNWPERARLTVYPQIVSLDQLGLPSRLPMGNLRTRQPLFYDPSRIAGVRDYYPGDDPRHIDWRNTARQGVLQVKQFDRTRQMPLAIFLDLQPSDDKYWRRVASEISIVVAASLANRANQLRQPFGLYSNGIDPYFRSYHEVNAAIQTEPGPAMSPSQGDAWLAEVLDKLAGLQPRREGQPLADLIGRWISNLAWGATVAVITIEPTPALAGELFRLRKAGYSPVAIFTGQAGADRAYRPPVQQPYSADTLRGLGFLVYEVEQAEDLNILAAGQPDKL